MSTTQFVIHHHGRAAVDPLKRISACAMCFDWNAHHHGRAAVDPLKPIDRPSGSRSPCASPRPRGRGPIEAAMGCLRRTA